MKLTATVLFALLLTNYGIVAQTRVDFHMMPAVSTSPLDPAFSPDGTHLVFAMRGDIWKVPITGGQAEAITKGPAYYFEPRLSPDGSRLALVTDIAGNLDIGLIGPNGGAVKRVTTNSAADLQPTWNPSGKSLYFTTRRNGNLDIYRLDVSTGSVSAVVATNRNEFQPAISPDGTKLAYISSVEGRNGSGGIWIKPLPSGEPSLVHYEETSYRVKPEWSHDGSVLYYSSDAAGSNDIAAVPSIGGNRVRLTEDELDEIDPAISPDGSIIAFVSNHRGPSQLYTLSSSGGARSVWKPVNIKTRKPLFQTGVLRGVVTGPEGSVVPARLMVNASDGRSYSEDGAFHRMVPSTKTHYQHTSGSFNIEVPTGKVTVEAMRGFEYLPARQSLDIVAGKTTEVNLQLKRIVNPMSRGWYSGDMHVHDLHEGRFGLTQEGFFHQVVADDLHVTNALIHMDGTKLMGRWEDLSGEPYQLSNKNYILRYSQEFRGSFGHVALIGVNNFIMPFIGGAANTPYAADVLKIRHIDSVHSQGGIAGFVHPYNSQVNTPEDAGTADIPVHVALGKGDFYDVVSIASLERDSSSVYEKLLNSGFRIAATGGTDNFSDVWYDPSGGTARTYAQIKGPLRFESWISAVKAGRTFATNGPLLFLEVDGRSPGDEIALTAQDPDSFQVKVELASIAPVDFVEVIVNGEVVHTWVPKSDELTEQFRTNIKVPNSGWVSARAIGGVSRFVGDAFAFALTSPVHIIRDEIIYTSAKDAQFLLDSVDSLWKRVEARNTWQNETQKKTYYEAILKARSTYQSIINAKR